METPEIDTPAVESLPTPKSSQFSWLWPDITNEVEAKKAAKSGAYAAAFIATLTGVLSLISVFTGEPTLGLDGWGLIDAVLFAVISWRIFKFSFPWAVAGLLLYIGEQCWRLSTYGPPKAGGIITTGLIFLALIAGARGTSFLSKAIKPA